MSVIVGKFMPYAAGFFFFSIVTIFKGHDRNDDDRCQSGLTPIGVTAASVQPGPEAMPDAVPRAVPLFPAMGTPSDRRIISARSGPCNPSEKALHNRFRNPANAEKCSDLISMLVQGGGFYYGNATRLFLASGKKQMIERNPSMFIMTRQIWWCVPHG